MNYDRYTSALRAEYDVFSSTLIADYLARVTAGTTIESIGAFRQASLGLVARFIKHATSLTDSYLVELGAGNEEAVRAHAYLHALRQIAVKNANDLGVRQLGGAGRMADVLTHSAGAIGALLQRKVAKPELNAVDKAGRRWPADKLVAVMARDFAYQTYLDREIQKMDEQGVTMVQVVYPDPTHTNHGMTMQLDEVGMVRKTIFHPNSSARLVPYVPT